MRLSAEDRTRLLGLLGEKSAALDELLAVTRGQPAILEQEDTDRFTISVTDRRIQLRRLKEIQPEIEALYGRYAEGEPQGEVDALIAEIDSKIREIAALDEKVRKLAEKLTMKIKDDLRKSSETRQTVVKYGQTGTTYDSDLFDKMS